MLALPEGLERKPWFSESCMLGVDEAGRGPVLGPMVYACVFAPISYTEGLAKRNYADSKTLTEEKREGLFEAVKADSSLGYFIDSLSAELISSQMLAKSKVSLNLLATNSTIKMIRTVIEAGVNLAEVYIDTVGDAERYAAKLSGVFPGIKFTVCPKADALYPIVSAASIVAKVTRDTAIQRLQAQLFPQGDGKLGSGYPADPDTKAWLQSSTHRVFGFPSCVRFSWETCSRIMEEHCVKVEWEGADDSQQSVLSFAAAGHDSKLESSGAGRHSYFRIRRLQRVAAF